MIVLAANLSTGTTAKSNNTIPKSVDKAMDRILPSGAHTEPGISIRNGPAEEMELDEPIAQESKAKGAVTGKRKSRTSAVKTYTETSTASDDDDKPLV